MVIPTGIHRSSSESSLRELAERNAKEQQAAERKKTEEIGYFEKGALWLKNLIWKVVCAVMRFFGFWKEEAGKTAPTPMRQNTPVAGKDKLGEPN
jgi:hypothetical protein